MFFRRENELAKTRSNYNPRNIFGVLDKFSEFKKPVQITEITFPAYSESSEDEEIQAEIRCVTCLKTSGEPGKYLQVMKMGK